MSMGQVLLIDSPASSLSSPPFDSVAQVQFSPMNLNQLLLTRYAPIQFYDITANEQKTKFDHRAAVLACMFGHAYSGGLDMGVRKLDLAKVTYLGQHENVVCQLCAQTEPHLLITGSWNQSLQFWDPCAETVRVWLHTLPKCVYHMDVVNHMLVMAMASLLFHRCMQDE
ncbi:hypothetical protein EV363DRAFT_1379499 [Boletus edulis]|nr:hypothetical protein EV363DRAFT_1379499 [Boletus edulis]